MNQALYAHMNNKRKKKKESAPWLATSVHNPVCSSFVGIHSAGINLPFFSGFLSFLICVVIFCLESPRA
jgi:hypothetical protein